MYGMDPLAAAREFASRTSPVHGLGAVCHPFSAEALGGWAAEQQGEDITTHSAHA